MKAKPVEPVDGIGQKLVPAAFTLVLAILSVIPLGIPGYAQVTPNYVLMSIYYWTIYRPDHLPYLVVFLIGLLVDSLGELADRLRHLAGVAVGVYLG